MSKKASPTMIGIFTLVGLLIGGAAIVVFGAGKYFKHTHNLLLYCEKSANGLQIGSDVRFAGVKIGNVKSISVIMDRKANKKILPVVVELIENDLHLISTESGEALDLYSFEGVERAVSQGLRGGMKQQSLLTGQLYIEFDIIPNIPGFVYGEQSDHPYPVVPTVGTDIDEIISEIGSTLKKFNALDLNGIIDGFRMVLVSTKDQIAALNLKEINDNVVGFTSDIHNLTRNGKLAHAIDNLDAGLAQLEQLTTKANAKFDPLMTDLSAVITKADSGLANIDAAAKAMSDLTGPRSPVMLRMQNVLQETERASRAIKELSNDLKRDPNSLLSGKATPK